LCLALQKRGKALNKSESRYFNTSVRMNNALLAVLEEKPFEYITVSEICKKAEVNRSTFYLHYENMCDLLAETIKRMIDNFLSYFCVDKSKISKGFSDCELSELNYITSEYLFPYLSYIKENRRIFLTMLAHTDIFGFESIFQRLFDNIFDPILERFNYPPQDRKYVMIFYLSGINAIIIEWLRNECDKPIDDVSSIIFECIFGLDEKIV